MKVTLYMAMSVNGMIARENGDEDFLSHDNWRKFCSLVKEFGNFIVGRKTYEAVKSWHDGYGFDDLKAEKVVISQNKSLVLDESYTVVSSPKVALKKLKERGFKKALLTGGSTINSLFAKEKLIDEIILNVEPVFVGRGIPIFSPENFNLSAKLSSIERVSKGIITLRYIVQK